VIMPDGGGRETGIGEGMGCGTLGVGGVSRLRCVRGGREGDSVYSYGGDLVGRSRYSMDAERGSCR